MNPRTLRLNLPLLSQGLQVDTETIIHDLKDGRVASRWSERWCQSIYNLQLTKRDTPNFDAVVPENGELVSIRTLTESGIRIQKSINQGGGRRCSKSQLIQSAKSVDLFIFVDIINIPLVKFIPVRSQKILQLVNDGVIIPSGLSPNNFYYYLGYY